MVIYIDETNHQPLLLTVSLSFSGVAEFAVKGR